MKKIIIFLIIFLSISSWCEEIKINITNLEKLESFFNDNFPEQKWPKEVEESFNIYIASITKDMDKKNLFIWKGDIISENIPAFFVLSFNDINLKGIDFKKLSIHKYHANKFLKTLELDKHLTTEGVFYLSYSKNYKNKFKLEENVFLDVNTNNLIGSGRLFVREIIYKKDITIEGRNYYSKRLNDYVFVGSYAVNLDKNNDIALWFSYNYPDNSVKWPKEAKESFEKIIKKNKWTFIHKGDLLKNGNPTVLMLNYITTDKYGEEKIALRKLKIIEYSSKWKERLNIDDGSIYVDSVLHKEYSPYYDSTGYYYLQFIKGYDDIIYFTFNGPDEEELNQTIYYHKNRSGARFRGTDMQDIF